MQHVLCLWGSEVWGSPLLLRLPAACASRASWQKPSAGAGGSQGKGEPLFLSQLWPFLLRRPPCSMA